MNWIDRKGINKNMWSKLKRRRNVKSLFTLCFDVTLKNIDSYVKDDSLQYLTPRIKDKLLKSLSHSFWRQNTFKYTFALLLHSKLEMIDLTNAHLDDDLLHTLGICKMLKKIYLIKDGSYSISKQELVSFLKNQTELETLQLRNCGIVDDSVLECLSEYCQKITALDVKGCEEVTDNGLNFLRSLKCLQCVTLSKTKITNYGLIEFIKEPVGKLLKELILDNCMHIDIEGLKQVPTCCPNLEIFVFYNCKCSEDMAMLYQEQNNLKNLKQLTWSVSW